MNISGPVPGSNVNATNSTDHPTTFSLSTDHHTHHHHHQNISNNHEENVNNSSTTSNPMIQGINALGLGRVYTATSLPSHIWSLNGFRCPVCNKFVLPDDIECHIVMCLTKPRLSYNEDVLNDPKGECVICLEDLNAGDVIARLPCLCIYHKICIDKWFEVNRSCPEHPSD